MRTLASLLVALAALFALPRSAAAFCGFYVSGADASLVADATQVVLLRDGTRTVIAMQNDYKGPPEDFAMVVPVPVVLQKENVKTLPRDVFARLDKLSAPRLVEYWEQDPCPTHKDEGIGLGNIGTLGHGAGGSGQGFGNGHGALVKVEAKFEVGEYDIVILSSKSSSALDAWLKENKYKIPSDAEPLLRPYVQAGSKFFVAKVNASKIKLEDGVATLSPLRFHFDSDKLELPVRLGLVNSSGKQDLVVQILSPGKRYEVANYPNITIPTNLDVAEAARGRFGDFYAALFDDTMKKTPNAVVTEYAWGSSGCDPCPTGVAGLPPEDLVTLGADVLPSVLAQGGAMVGGGRGARAAPILRQGEVTVSAGLPKEVVQRILRQNFGRFRLCYEKGLTSNPNLQGRVAVKLQIDKSGAVKSSSDGGSDLPDPGVVSCMVRAAGGLSFPAPDGDKEVSVVYPLILSPGPAGSSGGAMGLGFGGSASSNLPAFVLTRLHTRYSKTSLGADLVFREADPITGGREVRGANGKLEQGAVKASINNFQARYAIRHPWPGKIACADPRRDVWGGPWPDAGASGETIAATKTAYAKRDGVSLSTFLTSAELTTGKPDAAADEADAGAADAAPTGAATAPAPASKCGCRAVGAGRSSSGGLGLLLAALAVARRRSSRERRRVLASPAGVEPATNALGKRCSIH